MQCILTKKKYVQKYVQRLSLLHAGGETEVLGCIRESVDAVLHGFLRVSKKSAVRKQQLICVFLDGFRACEETSKVVDVAVCFDTGVDAVWRVLFCLTENTAEEDGGQCGGQGRTPP